MSLNVGVNVQEVDGRANPTIQGAPTSIAAFVGMTERGVPNLPVRVTSPQQFQDRFGTYLTSGYLAYAVDGFFLNGGTESQVCRVVGAGAAAATFTLVNRILPTATPALRVTAGYRGRPDPGAWGNRLRLDVRDDPRGSTTLQVAAPVNAVAAQLVSLAGFAVGSVARFVDGGATFYRKITVVEAATRTIRWDPASPIAPGLALATTAVTSAEFRLTVRYQSTPTADFAVVEDWRTLSMETDSADYAVDRINNILTGSSYVAAADQSGAAATGIENPTIVSNQALIGGVDVAPVATDYSGVAAAHTGFFALDTVQVQLLAVPDVHRLAAGRDVA